MNYFVVSDIHGCFDQFEEIISEWNKEDLFYILGDLLDRGPKSLKVIETVMELCETYPNKVFFIKGNHEDILIKFLENPEEKYENYIKNGGLATLSNLLGQNIPEDVHEIVRQIKEKYPTILQFIKNAPLYKQEEQLLFTHAGFNSEFEDFTQTTDIEFIWIRKHYEKPNKTPYVNIFGHTPVTYIHNSAYIWISADQKYIAIDGGCYETGQLNALRITGDGTILNKYSVKK